LNPRYLLDTNILSEPLRPSPSDALMRRLRRCQGQVATGATVWHELLFGCNRLPPSKKRTAIEKYLNAIVWPLVPILPYDASAARWHAAERARLEKIGKTPSFADGQIAAIAAANALVLVTANTEDYAGFKGIEIENWST